MNEVNLEGISESFVGGWFIDSSVCDTVIENFEVLIKKTKFDKDRGYHRLPNNHLPDEVHRSYMKQVHQVFDLYQQKYEWSNTLHVSDWFITQPYNIQKYDPGYNYKKWHIEDPGPRKGKMIRHLTFMTYLNDIEKGGETEYMYQNLSIKPQKGLTLIWPAGWTHPHRGIPAPSETKYIATGWASFKHRC